MQLSWEQSLHFVLSLNCFKCRDIYAVLECVRSYNIAMMTRKGFGSLLFITNVSVFSDLSNLKLLSSVPGRDGNRKEFGDSDSSEQFLFLKIRLVFQ